MNDIKRLLEEIRASEAASNKLQADGEFDANADILQINNDAIQKRRNDLIRKVENELRLRQEDLIEYRLFKKSSDRYSALSVAKSLLTFQELVTAIFDAIRSVPKKRYRPSPESVALSSLDFATAGSGSVLISMSIPNDRLMLTESDLDMTFELMFTVLQSRSEEEFKELVDQIGIASITKVHAWANEAAESGLNTEIQWGKSFRERKSYTISSVEASEIREVIDATSDEQTEFYEYDCILEGIDISTSYFHVRIKDGAEIKGDLSDGFPLSREWATNRAYTCKVKKSLTIKYATGQEIEKWTLLSLLENEVDFDPDV